MAPPAGSIEIRDVRGHVTIGDNNVVVSGDRSFVQVVRPGERPAPVLRSSRETALLPWRPRGPLGREADLRTVVAGLAEGGAYQVHGPPGMGKSTLLRLAAHRLAHEGGGPVVFVDAAGRTVGDVLQDVFEACYEAPGYRPGPTELRRLMAQVRIRVVLDDLEVDAQKLDTVLDAVPASVLLYAGVRRTLLGRGGTLALAGLGHADALTLLSQGLGRPLEAAEQTVAEELWRATAGAPLRLLHATATGGLTPAAGLDGLLAGLLESLGGAEREVAAILAIARGGAVSTALLSRLLGGVGELPMVCERLAAQGIVVATERGHRLSPAIGADELASLRPGSGALVDLADRLTQWVDADGTEPAAVAQDAELLTAVIDATAQARRPEVAARLARAASPALACSLRTGAWGSLLDRGIEAAQGAGLRDIAAYLTHENGIRKLVSGKRVAAATAFAAAAALWRELGSDGHAEAADAAAQSCGSGPPQGAHLPDAPDGGASGADALGHPDTSSLPPDSATGGDPVSGPDTAGDAVHETTSHLLSSTPPADPGAVAVAAKTGAGLTAKVVVGGGIAAAVTAGGVVIAQQAGADTVPVKVTVTTHAVEARMPGKRESGCSVGDGSTDCTTVVPSKKGESGPVSVDPTQPLPPGISLLYWGCNGAPEAESCTVTADRPRHVCVTTTSPADESARRRCAELTGSPEPSAVFRPLAWTTKTQIKVLTEPDGRPRALATTGERTAPGQVVWSEDGSRVAWTEVSTAPAEDGLPENDVVKMADLTSGQKHSWECFSCTLAFVEGELVSSGADVTRYPADGGKAKDVDLPQIPSGPAHDGPPNTTLVNSWDGGELRAYALSAVQNQGDGQAATAQFLLTRLETPQKARRIVEIPRLDRPGLWAVAPDGERAVVDLPTGQPPYGSCGESFYPVGSISVGSTTVPVGELGLGWRLDEAWYDTDGTAHAVYRRETGPDADHCETDTSRAPAHFALAPGADAWKRLTKEPRRTLTVIDGRPVVRTPVDGTFSLTVTGAGQRRTLDTGVEAVFPSAAY
ncbi:hypothetical protein ACWGJ2_33405 [Streptomyces sp. NPDC054796]